MTTRWFTGNEGIRVFASDFLISRVLRTLGPDRTFVLSTIIYVLVPWLWSLRDDTVGASELVKRGLTSPENNYIYVLPFLFGAIAHYLRESVFLVPRLIERGVLGAPRGVGSPDRSLATEAIVHRIVAAVSSSWLSRAARPAPLIAAIVVPTLFLFNGALPESRPDLVKDIVGTQAHDPTWLFSKDGIRPVAFYFSFALHGVGIATLTTWAISHLRAARLIRRLLADDSGLDVNLRIQHPDDCMGLRPISDMVRHSAIVLLLISLTVFLWSAGFLLGGSGLAVLADSGFRVAWAFYLAFAPWLFFAPLAGARRCMWILKEETLADLGRQVNEADEWTDRGALLDDYRLAEQANVWPFTWATLSSFFASLGVPLLITALSEVITRLVTP